MTERQAFWQGWNDACWGRPWSPGDCPEQYADGWATYLAYNR